MRLLAPFLALLFFPTVSGHASTIRVPADQPTIQAGIDAAVSGDTVLVADGTYSGDGNRDIDFGGKAIVVRSERGYNFTWIDVQGEHRGFTFRNGEDNSSKLEGFTITGVSSNTTPCADPCTNLSLFYSGVVIDGSVVETSPTISKCQFAENSGMQGAGIVIFRGRAIVDSCLFIRNTAYHGGAMFVWVPDSCRIRNCEFIENHAILNAGAIYAAYSPGADGVFIEHSRFVGNFADDAAGVLKLWGTAAELSYCTFENNHSPYGAVVCVATERGAVLGAWRNCTICDNSTAASGAGIICIHNANTTAGAYENCIIANNTGAGFVITADSVVPPISCCNLFDNTGGDWYGKIADQAAINGNMSDDPLFINPDSSDFRLQYCSPCNPFNNVCGELIGAFEIAPEETDPPYFSCHTDTLEYYLAPDADGECHVPLADYNVAEACRPVTLEPVTAWWGENGGIYWVADSGGLYQFTAMATKPPYGGDTCDVYVYVKGPRIDCPGFVWPLYPDSSGLAILPLAIENAFQEHVTVTPNIATWINSSPLQMLQFTADTAGTYEFTVLAETRFGADTCVVTATVGGPVIDCPADTVCGQPDLSGRVCVDLPVESGSLGEVTSGTATWINDELCFYPDDSGGVYTFPIVVNDAYGRDSCEVVVTVQPDVHGNEIPIMVTACEGEEVCIPYTADYVTSDHIVVLSPNATWTDDSICIVPNDTGLISFQIYAGTDHCYDTATISLQVHCPDTISITPGGTIQAAVDAASDGDMIVLEDGIYIGEGNHWVDFHGKNLTLKSKNGPANCIVDCGSATPGYDTVYLGIRLEGASYSYTVIDGLTFTNGAGIKCDGASPTIQNCVFKHGGGGISFANGSMAVVKNCKFTYLSPEDARGGATYIRQSSPTFEDCWFVQNYCWGGASAIEHATSEPIFRRCLFIKNGQWPETPYPNGGAIFLYDGVYPRFERCTFYGNRGTGSVLMVWGSTPCHADFDRCIVAFNRDDIDGYYAGGPINCNDIGDCNINLTCCNVFGNRAGDYIDCIAGELGVDGNMSADPWFRDTIAYDVHPLDISPCLQENNSCGELIGALDEGMFDVKIGANSSTDHDNVTITFDSVGLMGESVVMTDTTAPELPSYITTVPGNPRRFYYIQTDAVYEDSITLCFSYEDSDHGGEETQMKLLHYYNDVWDDITTSHDTAANVICGRTASLSPFCLTQPADPLDVEDDNNSLPYDFELSQNYPNPFNPSTTISFSIPSSGVVRLEVINILGQTVVTLVESELAAGTYEIRWDGTDSEGEVLASGIYLYRLRSGGQKLIKKMVLLK